MADSALPSDTTPVGASAAPLNDGSGQEEAQGATDERSNQAELAAESEEAHEGKCVQEIVYCLLDAKGGVSSTPSVQLAINTSVIQVAKANFPLVVSSIFSFLENRQSTEAHQLGLLRLLCQVLETRRSDGDGHAASCMINRTMARSLTHHLVREVAKLPQEDQRQRAISDVLVELAPMHSDVVLSGVLTMLDNCGAHPGNATVAPPALVKILTEIAYTTPQVLSGRIHEVMGRYLPLLQSCKSSEMKLLLFQAWCSLCVALVNCAMRENGHESVPSDGFAVAALKLRQRQPAAASGGGGPGVGTGGAGSGPTSEEPPEERRRVTLALGSAFTVLMSSWQSSKDLSIRVGAMECLGHLCLVIPKDQFLTNADTLLELLVQLLSKQSSASGLLPPMPLMRGLCLFLQSCIDADPEILLLENTLQMLISTLFAWVVSSSPLQCLQGSVGTELLQSQAEVLRCLEVLSETFRKEVSDFLLSKLRGTRDDRLGSLLILRHLIGSASWRPHPSAVIEGAQQLTSDTDPAVGLLLSELIVALAAADFLTVAEPAPSGGGAGTAGAGAGFPGEDTPRVEHVHALLAFLITQTAITQVPEAEQSSYVAKLVAKNYQPTGAPTCHEVRGRAGLVLGQLAGSLKPAVRLVLWPMLLQAVVSPAMRPGLPVLCRAVTQIVNSIRQSPESAVEAFAELALSLQPGRNGSTQPEAILMWLLICAHDPHETPGLGLSVLRCLESLSSLIHRVLGDIWEAPSKRLQVLCTHLEESASMSRFDADFWSSALSQEVHFFLSALPEHDELPSRLIDILQSLHLEVWRKERDSADLSDLQKVALFNLTGVCLGHVTPESKVNSTLEFTLSHCSDLITDVLVRRACARGLGIVAQRHFDLVLNVLGKAAKTDAATRRAGSITQSIFGKSAAVQQAEHLRAMLALALGYCAVYAPNRELLQESVREHILGPLHIALTQERALPVLQNVIESVKLAMDAIRMSPETLAHRDPFLSRVEQEQSDLALSQDPALRASLGMQRDELVRALLPFIETPSEQEDEQRVAVFEELIVLVLDAVSSLIALPLDLPSDLYASILEAGLHVLIYSIPNDTSPVKAGTDDLLQGTDPILIARIHGVTRLIKSLLFHAHSWLGVSRLLQAVYAAGANCPVEFIRWTCTQLLGVLCAASPILSVPHGQGEVHTDVGDWCECLALLLPRTGDSCRAVVTVAVDAVQQLLSRCEWTADVRIGALNDGACAADEQAPPKTQLRASEKPPALERSEGDPAPPSQQLVGALVARLPPSAIPPLVQHLMPAMHDADSRAALSGVDALYLILQACSEKLSGERATSLISTVFEEVEKVSHSSVRQRVLSCIKILAWHHFESAVGELLDTGPDFNASILGALQVLAKEKALLLRLLNHFTDTLNNSDPGTLKRPNRLVLAATVALGHLFTVNDSSIGMVVKKYFPQLFGTFLLRIGTTTEGLSAQQTAATFMNFLHASQNDSMAMALEGNRLTGVTRELYDEVIFELAALYCRHHPTKREALLQFIHPFLVRPFPGHRVATVTTLSQLLMSGSDRGLGDELVASVVQSLLRCVTDVHSTVRKQAIRGLGHLILLWQQRVAEPLFADEELVLRQVVPAACQALADSSAAVQKEAVVAVQRACQVENVPVQWRHLLLRSITHIQPLVDANDNALRGASLDLLGKLCVFAGPEEDAVSPDDSPPVDVQAEFVASLELLLVNCVVRLEDTSSAVASAAGRCLSHLVCVLGCTGVKAMEALELLHRREQQHTGFEQFVFPFVALAHRVDEHKLVARRLEICRTYFAVGPRGASNNTPPGNAAPPTAGPNSTGASTAATGGSSDAVATSGSAYSLPTCIAAGFVAAAFARCFDEASPRPSALLCGVCQDLMELIVVEDSDFRAQIARILGFFDILSRPGLA